MFFKKIFVFFSHIAEVGGEQCVKTVSRIIQVWKDRAIYSAEELQILKTCLDGIEGLSSPVLGLDAIEAKTPPIEDETPTTSVESNKVSFVVL